jgi:hypothetical protein
LGGTRLDRDQPLRAAETANYADYLKAKVRKDESLAGCCKWEIANSGERSGKHSDAPSVTEPDFQCDFRLIRGVAQTLKAGGALVEWIRTEAKLLWLLPQRSARNS